MNTGDLKNIVVIKDLPSNLIEEAIVVLKENQKIPKLEPASKDKKENSSETPKIKNSKDYIIKEAQMLIADYISKIENKNKKENEIVDDKIAKTLAKDITNAEVQLTKSESDDDSWLTEDMFGNDIGKIIVEEEPKEKETYSTGDFSEWAKSKKSK